MKSKAKQELHEKSIEELKTLLAEKLKELDTIRLNINTGKEKNLRAGKTRRQEITVVKSVIRAKELSNQ